jgi:hypothetical protein
MSMGVALVRVRRTLSSDPTEEEMNNRNTSRRLTPSERLEIKKVRLRVRASTHIT